MAITTPWFEHARDRLPLDEYPRPAAVRERWMNLNGRWQCRFSVPGDSDTGSDAETWRDILVPFAPETALSGISRILRPDETLTYRRQFRVPGDWRGSRIMLNFEAVDYSCRCRVNGRDAGSHTGGYLPFSFDITEFLTDGENELVLEVTDPTDTGPQGRGKQVLKPGGIWYTPTSGIWQTVWLEPVPMENHITGFRLTPDPVNHRLAARVEAPFPGKVRIRRRDDGPRGAGDDAADSADAGVVRDSVVGHSGTDLVLDLPADLESWSPDNPVLHDLVVELLDDVPDASGEGRVLDSQSTCFALRTLEKVCGSDGRFRLALNGKPIFLHGPLDQGYWPESGLTPPSDDAILFDLEQTKVLGFNMTRKHIKVESRRWYHHADRLGLVVIQDMVSGGGLQLNDLQTIPAMFNRGCRRRDDTPRAFRRIGRAYPGTRKVFEAELSGMMDHLHNHPSILVWVPFNEGWGQFDAARIATEVSTKDPVRLVDHASGWLDRGAGDFHSRHTYTVALRKPGRPDGRVFFYSEYGGYNLAVPGHMWDENNRFGYRFFKSREKLEAAYTELVRRQLIPLVSHGLSAAVYTQLSDVEIENNGYFTYDRKVLKMSSDLIRSLNTEINAAYLVEWETHHG